MALHNPSCHLPISDGFRSIQFSLALALLLKTLQQISEINLGPAPQDAAADQSRQNPFTRRVRAVPSNMSCTAGRHSKGKSKWTTKGRSGENMRRSS
jgi:hypothetical protein